MVGVGEVFEKALTGFRVRSNLRQPDRGLHRFDLTKEWSSAAEWVAPPVMEQLRCFRRDLPIVLTG